MGQHLAQLYVNLMVIMMVMRWSWKAFHTLRVIVRTLHFSIKALNIYCILPYTEHLLLLASSNLVQHGGHCTEISDPSRQLLQ